MTRSKMFRFLLLKVVLLILLNLIMSTLTVAQTSTATLSGTVTDQQDALLAGATVTVRNLSTGFIRTSQTKEDGSFIFPLLPPASYRLSVERSGFAPYEASDLTLNVGDQRSLLVQMKVGQVAGGTVDVTADAALVNTSPAISTTINRTFINQLPVNGRSFSSLVFLTPGVTVTNSFGGTDLGQFSVNGMRASTNLFLVDGVNANIGGAPTSIGSAQNNALSGAYPGTSTLGSTSNLVSMDALEEFTIQTSTYSAESGRQPGAQVQVVTRSGKNQFSGSAFEYFRNEALDARSYFNKKPQPQPALRQNQFGGTFGGPVIFPTFGNGGNRWYNGKDKTFFFFSYEAQRLRLPSTGVEDVPAVRVRSLLPTALQPIANAFPIPTGPEPIVSCFVSVNRPSCIPTPDPNDSPTAGTALKGVAPYSYAISNPSNLTATSLRIDQYFGSKLRVFGRFNEAPSDTVAGTELNTRTISSTRTLTLGSNWFLSSSLLNELNFNYSRQHGKVEGFSTSLGGAVPIDAALLTSGYPGTGNINLQFAGGSVGFNGLGIFADSYQRQINVLDNLTLIRGPHQFKLGFDFRRLSDVYGIQDGQSINFSTEAATLSGIANRVSIFTQQPSRPQFDSFSAFVQDTWKASRRFTFDLGLRWEVNPSPTERDGNYPRLVLGVVGSDVSKATLAPEGATFYKTFWTAFAPRLGAVYQLHTKKGLETVIRGGFGVYYDLGSGTAAGGWPFRASRSITSVSFPINPALVARPGIAPITLPTSSFLTAPNENLKLPYSLQWNVGIEQSLGSVQVLSVSYVGSAGRRLLTTQFLNGQPVDLLTGDFYPRPNPDFSDIAYSFNGPTSDYHSMQVQYRARLKQGLQALVNYTWSHAIDEVSSDAQLNVFERGNADFDVRHNFSAALHYDLPKTHFGPVLNAILHGWSVDTIIHAQSGRPVDIFGSEGTIVDDNLSLFNRPNLVPGVPLYIKDPNVPGGRRFNVAAFKRRVECLPAGSPTCTFQVLQGNFGRNILRELPLYQTDVALGRKFMLTEKLGLQLKAEAFNIFNHPMFGGYGNTLVESSTFGVPRITLSTGLGGLSSLYQFGGPRSIQLSARLSF